METNTRFSLFLDGITNTEGYATVVGRPYVDDIRDVNCWGNVG